MNGSLLAILGVVALVVFVLILLKLRTGKAKPALQPESEQEIHDVVDEAAAVETVEEGVEEAIEAAGTQEPDAVEEASAVVLEEEPRPLAEEEAPFEPGAPSTVVAEPEEEAAAEILAAEEPAVKSEDALPVSEAEIEPSVVLAQPQAEELAEPAEEAEIAGTEEPNGEPVVEAEPQTALHVEESTLPLAEALEADVDLEEVVGTEISLETEAEEELASTESRAAAEIIIEEAEPEEPAEQLVAKTPAEAVIMPELLTVEKPAEKATLSLVRLSMEEYAERLNRLEEQQRTDLAEAIERLDDQRRDQLQRELVVMNDRLALLADHYVEEMAGLQQVMDTLVRLQTSEPSIALSEAITELQTGKTEAAVKFLEGLSMQEHPLAVHAAFLSGQLAESRVDLQKAMGYYRQAVEQDPDNPEYLRAAGLMARSLYKYKEALPWLEKYVQTLKDGGKADTKSIALAQRELAYTCVLSGQYQKAGPLYKQSMTLLAQKLGQDHPEMAASWQQIGEFQETMGEYDKAVSLYKKALAILEKKRGPEHPALAGILRKLAALCIELELEQEAVPLYEKLVRIQEKALRSTHPQLVISLNNLAEAYRLRGRYAESEACYLKTLRINEELHGKDHPSVAAILQELAKLCTSQRKTEEAQGYQERASIIFQKSVEAEEKKAGAEESLTLELS